MGKVIDLTEKLSFEEKPVIQIKKTRIEVNNDAMTALKIIAMARDLQEHPEKFNEAATLLFGSQGMKSLEKLNLSMDDFRTVVEKAMDLAMGENEDEDPQNASMI